MRAVSTLPLTVLPTLSSWNMNLISPLNMSSKFTMFKAELVEEQYPHPLERADPSLFYFLNSLVTLISELLVLLSLQLMDVLMSIL